MADSTEKLERLFSLLEAGALTRVEFDEQKAALLAESRTGSAPGEPASATALLQTLGVGLAPTLSPSDPAYEPVQPGAGGAFERDISPYGVRDMAGGMRDWCGDENYSGDPDRRPIRGGPWAADARNCRISYRYGYEPWSVYATHGFRLACAVALPGPLESRQSPAHSSDPYDDPPQP